MTAPPRKRNGAQGGPGRRRKEISKTDCNATYTLKLATLQVRGGETMTGGLIGREVAA
jgi:hypothetical protein